MPSPKNYPIVLAHGIARFDFITDSLVRQLPLLLSDLSLAFDRLHYFRGIATYLRDHGFTTHHSGVSFAAGVETRARELRQEVLRILEECDADKVHIIGHSMGGLDSRYMIVHEGMADKVASLTTIGTPHLGTSFADWGLSHGGEWAIGVFRRFLSLDGFLTLTLAARNEFNELVRHHEATNSVIYQTYASVEERDWVFGPIRPSWQIINEAEGPNDGLVPLTSQQWTAKLVSNDGVEKTVRQHQFPLPADHLNQIGWWDLDELRRVKWWQVGILNERRKYETAIKNVYLKIAREVTGDSQN
ncbi:MAG TPA: alpha/beta fold hydrolase [Anaerolineae bacterium]